MNAKKIAPYLILTITIVWLLMEMFGNRTEDLDLPPRLDEDLTTSIEQLSIRQYDKKGLLMHTIQSEKGFQNTEKLRLEKPRIVTELNNARWIISSDFAITPDIKSYLTLSKNVVLQTVEQNPLILSTEELHYLAKERQLKTPLKASIQDNQTVISGTGLLIDLNKEEYVLESDVQALRQDRP